MRRLYLLLLLRLPLFSASLTQLIPTSIAAEVGARSRKMDNAATWQP